MAATFPFLTAYDPPGTSEGSLDPLGLYLIADQLAVQLVPAVRERMLRVRFLTAMAAGAMVTEGFEDDPRQRDAAPYLVWEWLVVESLVRAKKDDPASWGVAGSQVARRAVEQHGYLDARSYLKTPRIFGFNGVYKRLAIHLGLVDIHLCAGPRSQGLVDAWGADRWPGQPDLAKQAIRDWAEGVRRSLRENPPRTKPGWNTVTWADLADSFAPSEAGPRERRFLGELLLREAGRDLGAFTVLWQLQRELSEEEYREETLHDLLEAREPGYGALLHAIRAYETFARSIQDGFDVLRSVAGADDARGFTVTDVADDREFKASVADLHLRFERAHRTLGEARLTGISLQGLLNERFCAFAEPLDAAAVATALCAHHERIQRAKAAAGKRPWFDRLGPNRIHMRQQYRVARPEIMPGRYVHDYRGRPIRRFWRDLT
jgi:hypothetical protein